VKTSNIPVGAIAHSRSGNRGIVTQVESDRVVVKCPDGLKRVPISAIVRWELPPSGSFPRPLSLGDRVRYTGTDRNLQRLYAGELTIGEISKYDDGYACLKPDGRVTSWILHQDLKLATDTPSPLSAVTQPPRRISIGDEITIRSSQQRGTISLWYRNRSKAVIEFEDNTLSDWVPSSELVRISDGAIESTPSEPLPSLPANWKPEISPSDDESDDLSD
jgi:hypothetical protein